MMTDYISRDDGIRAIVKTAIVFCRDEELVANIIRAVGDVPAADVRPVVRGKWIKTEIRAPFDQDEFTCSECGSWPWCCGVTEGILQPYCPNCGASMVNENG